jgi:hypothetical protein
MAHGTVGACKKVVHALHQENIFHDCPASGLQIVGLDKHSKT